MALLRTVWDHRRERGALVASHEPPSTRGWDATVKVQWRGTGEAWHVLAIPYDRATFMARGSNQAHVLRDGDGELRFQVRYPARIVLLWRAGLTRRRARGHLLDTQAGLTRPMTNREVRAFLSRGRS